MGFAVRVTFLLLTYFYYYYYYYYIGTASPMPPPAWRERDGAGIGEGLGNPFENKKIGEKNRRGKKKDWGLSLYYFFFESLIWYLLFCYLFYLVTGCVGINDLITLLTLNVFFFFFF